MTKIAGKRDSGITTAALARRRIDRADKMLAYVALLIGVIEVEIARA